VTTRPRAADDFAVFRARVEELRWKRAQVSADPKGHSRVGPRPYHRAATGDAAHQSGRLLRRGGCPVETNAMGHCGNVPSQRPGTEFSVSACGDVERWYPVATFILDADGRLAKGRAGATTSPRRNITPTSLNFCGTRLFVGQGRRVYATNAYEDSVNCWRKPI
jgi:hypothetical protein